MRPPGPRSDKHNLVRANLAQMCSGTERCSSSDQLILGLDAQPPETVAAAYDNYGKPAILPPPCEPELEEPASNQILRS